MPAQLDYSQMHQSPMDAQQAPAIPPQVPQQYQQPVQDMGTSLGYGQGMEYQYVNTPQPSQPLPQLRQARLQQLREDRMRRQQRRMKSESPSFLARISGRHPSNAMPPPTVHPPVSAWNQQSVSQPPAQMSSGVPISPAEVLPASPSRLPPG